MADPAPPPVPLSRLTREEQAASLAMLRATGVPCPALAALEATVAALGPDRMRPLGMGAAVVATVARQRLLAAARQGPTGVLAELARLERLAAEPRAAPARPALEALLAQARRAVAALDPPAV